MNTTNVLILTAGRVPPDLACIFGEIPTGMIPVNEKPSILWIMEELIAQGFQNFFLSVDFKKEMVLNLLQRRFSNGVNLKTFQADHRLLPGNSIVSALELVNSNDLLIVLGDTIFKSKLKLSESCAYASNDFIDPQKWCLAKANPAGYLTDIFDKRSISKSKNLKALIGIYYFKKASLLKKIAAKLNASDPIEISFLLSEYAKEEPIRLLNCNQWMDIGHLENYYKTKIALSETRYFNKLNFESSLGIITKRSSNVEKLLMEIQWYNTIPKELAVLTPRVFDYKADGSPYIKMEYYGYATLSELYLYGNIHVRIWEEIVKKLVHIITLFQNFHGHVSFDDYEMIYLKKTDQRIRELLGHDKTFSYLFECDSIILNGKELLNYFDLLPFIRKKIKHLFQNGQNNHCLIHGDFCFSNILYDLKSGVVRMIDPRGKWGKSIYGDIRYDVAKLRHSIVGFYDYIKSDFFTVDLKENRLELSIFNEKWCHEVGAFFDKHASKIWDINEIKLIEGLLFLSMIPIHRNSKKHQLAMYATGLRILNDFFRNTRIR